VIGKKVVGATPLFFRSHPHTHVLGIRGKYGAVARNLWVYFLFWGCARLLLPLQNVPRKRVCMVENHSYRIWGAPDFYLPPSTLGLGQSLSVREWAWRECFSLNSPLCRTTLTNISPHTHNSHNRGILSSLRPRSLRSAAAPIPLP